MKKPKNTKAGTTAPVRAIAVGVGDQVTILVCDADHSASKRWIRAEGGEIEQSGYNAGMYFSVMMRPVSDIRTLSEVLVALEGMPTTLVIRGAPVDALPDVAVRRTKDNFKTPEAGRRWTLIDFDSIELPDGLALQEDAPAAIEHLVTLLPEEFHNCSYHYQLSSSAGMGDPRKASVHLWFWLTESWTDDALKAWAKVVNTRAGAKLVDPAVFNDVQPHYTAAPIFENVANPFPVRSGLVTKRADAVSIQFTEVAKEQRSQAVAGDFQPGLGFAGWLAKIGDHPGGEGFHDPIIRATASYVAEHGREGTDTEELFKAVSTRVLEADRSQHSDEAYVADMASRKHIMAAIESALAKYGDVPSTRRKSRVIEDLEPHFPADGAGDVASAQQQLDQALRSVIRAVR